MNNKQNNNVLSEFVKNKNFYNQFDHLPGNQRTANDKKISLGKKLNVMNINTHLQNHLRLIGMSHVNLIAVWE
jgi:hypothetical protein